MNAGSCSLGRAYVGGTTFQVECHVNLRRCTGIGDYIMKFFGNQLGLSVRSRTSQPNDNGHRVVPKRGPDS